MGELMKTMIFLLGFCFFAVNISAEVFLRLGSEGEQVLALQERLEKLNYRINVSGIFDDETRYAVLAFQSINQIMVDGIVGPQTRKALQFPKTLKPKEMGRDNFHIEVCLTRRIMFLVIDNQPRDIVFVCPGGPKTPTPKGSFRITWKRPGWRYAFSREGENRGRLYQTIYFKGLYALHGHEYINLYPSSLGCIRIPLVFIDHFYNKIERGTKVLIY